MFMREILVGYTNGDSTVTRINGSIQRIVEYYLGNRFTFQDESGREYSTIANEILFLDHKRFDMGGKEIFVHSIYLKGHFPVNVQYFSYCHNKEPMVTIGAYVPHMFDLN